jgi:hypothetical protein
MDWKDIAGDVGKAAPILGTLLGGPAGAAIGSLVASALGTANSADAVQVAIATDPAAAAKVAQAELDNQVKLQAMLMAHADNALAAQTAAIQADVTDRDSARKREIAVKGITPTVLAWVVVGAAIALAAAVTTGYVTKDPALATLVGTVIGYLFGEAKQVMAYYFGNSSGSARQTELLAKSVPAAEPNASTGP